MAGCFPLSGTTAAFDEQRAVVHDTVRATRLENVATATLELGGNPIGVAGVGSSAFASVRTACESRLAVLDVEQLKPELRGMIELPTETAASVVLTDDGRYLLVAADSGAIVVSVSRVLAQRRSAVLGVLRVPRADDRPGFRSALDVAVSRDGRFAFVALEFADRIAVYDLGLAVRTRFSHSAPVALIPTGRGVAGLARSPDGRWLYASNQIGGRPVNGVPSGTISVVDLTLAERRPNEAVIRSVPAGHNPVRVAVSPAGDLVWATARESNELIGFSAKHLVRDPQRAVVARLRVGQAPVGLLLVREGKRALIADSNRFSVPGSEPDVLVVDTGIDSSRGPAVLGYLPTGAFPRALALVRPSSVALVANFGASQLQAINVDHLP